MAGKQGSIWCCCVRERVKDERELENEEEKMYVRRDSDVGGNPRNKVALLPGHSLMDWIRLGNSGVDLTGVGGEVMDVTEEELAQHSVESDAWIAIRGKVYNITPYMKFHPGGIPELMRGIGKDATKLFMDIHPWVNYESILKKCYIGRLVRAKNSATTKDFENAFFENVSQTALPDLSIGCKDESIFDSDIKMTWCQTVQVIKFVFQVKVSSPHIIVHLKPDHKLRILIRVKKKLHVFGFQLEKKVLWPCIINVNTDTGRVELEFTKKDEGFWSSYGVNDKDHALIAASVDEIETYHKAKIIQINQLTHNVRTFVFKFIENILMWVPIGHDIRIRAIIEGIDYAKQYTPVPPYLPHGDPTIRHWHQDYICCMVKYYSEGALTPYLFAKSEKDVVDIGGMGGSFNIRKLSHAKELYLIAAGSGLSPMLRIIVWGVSKKDQVKSMNLLFMNRNREDIIWKKELDDLSKKEKWFKVTYCLSQPDEKWKGMKGRINDEMLNEFLPDAEIYPDELPDFYICACGPIQFAEMVQEYLNKKKYESCSHCFIG